MRTRTTDKFFETLGVSKKSNDSHLGECGPAARPVVVNPSLQVSHRGLTPPHPRRRLPQTSVSIAWRL